MSAQFDNHFDSILAFLSSTGHVDVYGNGVLAYSSVDKTLRLHDGCTKGGRWKMALTPRCVDMEGNVKDPRLVPKGPAIAVLHTFTAQSLTPAILASATLIFKAAWPDAGGNIEVVSKFSEEEIEITKVKGAALQTENFAKQINDVLGQYGIEAAATTDTLAGKGRVAVRGPDALGPWSLEVV